MMVMKQKTGVRRHMYRGKSIFACFPKNNRTAGENSGMNIL